jgi:hypothetical protein
MSSTCKELMFTCNQAAEHADVGCQEMKKVQDHIKKMAALCKVLNDTLAQKV